MTLRASKHVRVVQAGGLKLWQPKPLRNELAWLDINPAYPFRDVTWFGPDTRLRGDRARRCVVQLQNFTSGGWNDALTVSAGGKNKQIQFESTQEPLTANGVETENPPGGTPVTVGSISVCFSTPTAFSFSKSKVMTDGLPRSGEILSRVADPDGASRTVYRITLNKALLQAPPRGNTPTNPDSNVIQGDEKARCIFGGTQVRRADQAVPTANNHAGQSVIDKFGREVWIAYGVKVPAAMLTTPTNDGWIHFQMHSSGVTIENDEQQNPLLALTFFGGGNGAPDAARLNIKIRRQLAGHLDFVGSRTAVGGGTDQEVIAQYDAPGWTADWAYFVMRVVPSYLDNPATELPAEYLNEWVSPLPKTGRVQVWAKFGDGAIQSVCDFQGRWGNNDERTANVNTGCYYYGAPPLWDKGNRDISGVATGTLDAERVIYHTGLFGAFADDWPGMTPLKMLSLIPGSRAGVMTAAAPSSAYADNYADNYA